MKCGSIMIKMKFREFIFKTSRRKCVHVESHIPDLKLCFSVKKTSVLNGGTFNGGV